MVQLRITKFILGFLLLVGAQVFILRTLFAPTITSNYDDPLDDDVLPEFLAYKSIEQEAYNTDIEELQLMLADAQNKLFLETAENTKWQEAQELKLHREREVNEMERVEFHRLLEEATEKKNKREREAKAKQLLLTKLKQNAFTDDEWQMRPGPGEWTATHVLEWARTSLNLDPEDLLRLSELKVSGAGLLKLRKEDFLAAPSPFPLGSATLLADGILELLSGKSENNTDMERVEMEAKKSGDGEKRKRLVAVIGAGFGGISTARELLENGCTPILIEESKKPGGIWTYDPDPEVTSGYSSLHAQGLNTDVNFRNFIIPKSYPARLSIHQMGSHIKNFWDTFGLEKYAVFDTRVTKIESLLPSDVEVPSNWLLPVINKKLFRVHWTKKEKKDSGLVETHGHFDVDAVVQAVGRNHIPNLPVATPGTPNSIEGYDTFKGISIHSKFYRVPEQFKRKTVIVAGGGKSGTDIVEDLRAANITVIHSSRSQGNRDRIYKIIKEIDGSFTVHFWGELSPEALQLQEAEDAKLSPAQLRMMVASRMKTKERSDPVKNVDAIIWAWGWQHNQIEVVGPGYTQNWYKDVLCKTLPGLTRVGTVSFLGTTRIQSIYASRVLAGRIPIDTNSTTWKATTTTWGHPGSDQYLWHELVTY